MPINETDREFIRHRPARNCVVYCRDGLDGRWELLEPLFDRAWEMEPLRVKRSRKIVVQHEIDGKAYYVKICSRRHASAPGQKLLRASSFRFFRSKAYMHLHNALIMRSLGLKTVNPLLVIESRYGFLRQEGMFVTEESTLPLLPDCLQCGSEWRDYPDKKRLDAALDSLTD